MRKFLYIILAVLLASIPAYAAQKVGSFGIPNSSGTAPLEVDSDRMLSFATDAGIKASYEAAVTSDTITASESGKTFIIDPVSPMTLTLPDADVGLNFTFTSVSGTASGGATKKFILDPKSTDRFRGVVSSVVGTTFAIGDSVISTGVTGDSITIFCGQDTYWDVTAIRNTFVDAN
jgi:hypothetical protein